MNEDNILKAIRNATPCTVSRKTDEAVLKAAREKAEELRRKSATVGASQRRRFTRIAAVAAALVLACGAALMAGGYSQIISFLGLARTPEPRPAQIAEEQASPFMSGESSAPSGGAIGGSVPTNDEPYPVMFLREFPDNPAISTDDETVSTFAADTDTGFYTLLRKYLNDGNLPPEKAVRVEEIVNYFDYQYAPPKHGVLAVHVDGAPSKFGPNEKYYLLRVGIKAKEVSDRPDANIVLAVDVSSSMAIGNRLDSVRDALGILLANLRPSDRVALVTFGHDARIALPFTPVKDKPAIMKEIDSLAPEAGDDAANLEAGLKTAYGAASEAFNENKINRVILCSDGVANVGRTGPESIGESVLSGTKKGICLSTVGFGIGYYNDYLMEQLADEADGNYSYIDTRAEAKRVFGDDLTGLLYAVARDVKVNTNFNAGSVKSFRLIGYENRTEGETGGAGGGAIGAGQSMTALYELKLAADADAIGNITVSYTDTPNGEPTTINVKVARKDFADSLEKSSASFKLAAASAEFAQKLRTLRIGEWGKKVNLADVLSMIKEVREERPGDAKVAELQALILKADRILKMKADTQAQSE